MSDWFKERWLGRDQREKFYNWNWDLGSGPDETQYFCSGCKHSQTTPFDDRCPGCGSKIIRVGGGRGGGKTAWAEMKRRLYASRKEQEQK